MWPLWVQLQMGYGSVLTIMYRKSAFIPLIPIITYSVISNDIHCHWYITLMPRNIIFIRIDVSSILETTHQCKHQRIKTFCGREKLWISIRFLCVLSCLHQVHVLQKLDEQLTLLNAIWTSQKIHSILKNSSRTLTIYRKLVSEDTDFSKLFSFVKLELAKVRRRGALSPP